MHHSSEASSNKDNIFTRKDKVHPFLLEVPMQYLFN